MKLLTKAIENKLPKLYEQDGLGMEAVVHVKFFHPLSAATWFITEYDGEDIFFGWVLLNHWDCAELGYISKKELEELRVRGLGVERDLHFKPQTLNEAIAGLKKQMGVIA